MNARAKTVAVTALRIAVTGGSLALALLLIDFSDRTIFTLRSGERVETTSWLEAPASIRITRPDGSYRDLSISEIARREERPGIVGVLKRANPMAALIVVPALLAVYLVQAIRWRVLLQANGFEIPFGRAFLVTWAGIFFNQILPGSVGGDVAKALIASRGEVRKAGLFGTVLLDRLVGLGTIIVIAGLAVVPVLHRPALRPVVWLIAALIGGGALGAFVYFHPALRRWPRAQRLKNALPFRKSVEEVDDVLKTMHHAPRAILEGVGLSAVGQAITILAIYGLAVSLGVADLRVGDFFLIQPIIFLITAVPVSIGGWGVEQFASVHLFGMAGMAPNEAMALSVLYKLATLAVSLPGGLLFAAGATKPRMNNADVP